MTLFLFSLTTGLFAEWLFAVNTIKVFAITYLFFTFIEFMIESYNLGNDWKSKVLYVFFYVLRFAYFYLLIPLLMSHVLAVGMYEAIFLVTYMYIIAKLNNWE
jgi:hypothetical protein